MKSRHYERATRKAALTRVSIVSAAHELLAEGGAEALTIESLSTRADVAVQTIYNRIGGRSAVLLAVAESAFEENRQYMDAAYALTGTPIERIRAAAAAYAAFAFERPLEFRLLADPPSEPHAADRIADLVTEQNLKLEAAISDGVADGSLRSDIDPHRAATALWAMTNGLLALTWRADRLRAAPDEVAQLLTMIEPMLVGDGTATS